MNLDDIPAGSLCVIEGEKWDANHFYGPMSSRVA